jgi:hypothetical protein
MKTKVINYRAGQHSRASVARRLQMVLISAGFLAVMLCFPVCKLATPAAFLDATPDSNELLKTMNVRNNGELWSGVITGTLPNGAKGVDVKFDDGEFTRNAIIEGYSMENAFIPTGAAQAAAGKQSLAGGQQAQTLFAGQRRDTGIPMQPLNSACINFTRQLNKDANGDGYADVVVGRGSANDGGTGAFRTRVRLTSSMAPLQVCVDLACADVLRPTLAAARAIARKSKTPCMRPMAVSVPLSALQAI